MDADSPTVKPAASKATRSWSRNGSAAAKTKSVATPPRAAPAPEPSAARAKQARAERPQITDSAGQVQNVGLDQLMAEAAHTQNRFIPGSEFVKALGGLAKRPSKVAGHTATVVSDLARIITGESGRTPLKGDSRFRDPAWTQSWLFRRICQSYLSISDFAHALADEPDLEWADRERLHLILDNLIDALSPTNFPLTNPTVWKTTIDRGGENFVTGARAALRDARSPVKLPANVDKSPFKVGETLAASPGAVVRRDERFELIQYEPRVDEVYKSPVLLIPPMISKYYVVDLSPGKSMVEFLGDHGLQPFALSWANPTRENAGWSLEDYLQSIVAAIETTREVTGADAVHVVGFCAGGIATAIAVAHLAALGKIDHVATLSLMVTVLDVRRGGPVLSMASPDMAEAAKAKIRRKGYLAGTELARTFAWLRPNEMIWNNFVNNYYLGNKPPAFDLLFWNQDSMNMPAALHADLMDIGMTNPLIEPGALTVLGTPIDLRQITCDSYVAGGETDHLTPWPSCYRSVAMLGGKTKFALSTSGHIAAVIHPPGNPKSSYRLGDESCATPEEWLRSATMHKGTWWQDWAPWLVERAGEKVAAPKRLGNKDFRPLTPAPGKYVLKQSQG
ncbi:MAG: alpha/beta fold hydrolase [Actinomycetota bacterium]|uniref:Alpha/beta hydrolase n=1 Tax=Mycobacterium lentiflavum TaxID=141349 RepID=A0ABY3UT70_MYCLN|nr:alpha/beta fold hydrolase [Mycobacterium lentiflavum]MEE3062447.1 alpha/beta fold hydrolase [Actinomycetota bacterium]ULP40331.1 alpha/beta hydrolase [Mycobacterium lentiflavum]